MNRQKWLLLIVAIGLMAGTAGGINWYQANRKLGRPGILAIPIPGSVVMRIDLPEKVLDYTSEELPEAEAVTNMLPKDTSYAQRRYLAPDGFALAGNVVLMGTDRTSIHKPERCLPGQGLRIDTRGQDILQVRGPRPYKFIVAKWLLTRPQDGARLIYVYWFVADNELTTSHGQRVWWLARDLLTTGVLQRWAYISYYTLCPPGQEDATYERVKTFIAASVPEFQLPPKSAGAAAPGP